MPVDRVSRRTFMKAGAAGAAPCVAGAGSRPPNLVFLISDDHSAFDLGCYGNAAVHTPNLDRMAGEGVRFNNCFVASPQCSPNRSAILTGCTPHTTATSRLHTPMPEWEPTVLEALKGRGYFTGAFRKVHQGDEFNKRWDFYTERGAAFERFFDGLPAERPFFLHVGFTDPHRPYKPGAFSPPHDPSKVVVPAFLPDSPDVRQDIAHYYDFIARMDAECGRIMAMLNERGLDQNTLVIFTSDNGMPFPRAKGTCYDPGIHVPLIARWPGRIARGGVRNELISHVDLPATWLEAAGLPAPGKMQGRSFLRLLTGGSYAARSEVFAERNWHNYFDPMRAVRTDRYKLIFNAVPHFPYRPPSDLEASPSWRYIMSASRKDLLRPEHRLVLEPVRPVLEMYDLREDPGEFNNLAQSPAHAAIREDLVKRLSGWMQATCDFLPPGGNWPLTL